MTSAWLLALAATTGLMPTDPSAYFLGDGRGLDLVLAPSSSAAGAPPAIALPSTPVPTSPSQAWPEPINPPWAPPSPPPIPASPQVTSFGGGAPNPNPVGVYVDFATGPDEASASLGIVPVDPSRPLGGPWYTSPTITHLFSGVPTLDQQQQLKQAVIAGLNQDYATAGLPVRFSTNPAGAARVLGILTNATDPQSPTAIGIGTINGRDAVTFLDRLDFATNERSLINAVQHNGDHEIGHTLGMEHTSADGFINSAVISTAALMKDDLTFTPDAVHQIQGTLRGIQSGESGVDGQTLLPTPEPASWLVVATVLSAGLAWRRRAALPG